MSGRPGALLRASLLGALTWGVLCLAAAPANAQQIAFRKYDQTDGLANLVVLQAVPAPDGNLWIGTEAGAFRFDGTAFVAADTTYGLPRVRVFGIEAEPSGRIWIWYKRALFVGSAAGFAPVRTTDGDLALDAGSSIVPLADDRFVATVNHRLLEFHRPSPDDPAWVSRPLLGEQQIASLPALAGARLLARDRRGTLWMSCGQGLCSLEANQPRIWGPTDGIPKDTWAVVLEDRDGRLWARGTHHLNVRELGAARFRANEPGQLSEQKFLAIGLALDGRGRVLTDVPSGMARWDGAAWREFTSAHGFPAAVSHVGKPDADGNLWLGVEGHGLWRWLGYDDFESWTSSEGFSDLAGYGIERISPTRLVVGLDHGCQAFDEQRRRFEDCPFGPLDGLTIVPVSRGPDGATWLGSTSGTVWRARPGEEKAMPIASLPPGHLTGLDVDARGTWWISSESGGLVKLDGATGHVQQVDLPPAAGFPSESIAVNANERCVATEFGLVRIRGARGEEIAFFPFTRDGRPAGFLSLALGADGTVWAASTAVGLLRARGCSSDGAQWIMSDLIDPTVVYTVRTDRRGWVWAGTDHGVALYDGKAWRRTDVSDGLLWNDTDQKGLLADADGSMWITTPKGVSHFLDPEGWVARQSRPLDVALMSAEFGGQRLDRPSAGPASAAWRSDTGFAARLTSHSHDRSARTQYQYRLVGLADQWSTTRTPDIDLPALDPGHYRLEARAIDPDHARMSPTIALAFEIVPPWWRTRQFFMLAALAALAVLAAGVRQVLRRRTRLLHEQNEASFRRVIDLMPDLISMTRDGALVYANRASRQFIGDDTGPIERVHPDDRAKVFDQHRSVRDGGSGPELLEARIRASDGSWRTCELSAIRAEFAGAITVITSARDITERKRIGAQLMVADRMTSLGTLAAGIAHEINNPLAFVIGNLEAMGEIIDELTIAERGELTAQLHDARDGADRVRKIVRGLRSFTRSEEELRAPLSLDDILEAATRLTGNELRHRAQLVREARPVPSVVADDGRLTQVFINLLVNAAHAIPEGHADHNRITVRTRTDDSGHAVVEVEDTGAGMAADVQARAFEPFFTTKDVGVGTGLGLSICHGIITGLGGQIAIASEVGRGTSVRIVLPPYAAIARGEYRRAGDP